jgi:Xaa-Pro aminopeptidase
MAVPIYGDTERSPALRHEVPLAIIDPFLYLESNGTRAVLTNVIELPRISELEGLDVIVDSELGWDELLAEGRERWDAEFEVAVRAVERLGITEAAVPPEFPIELADRLRERGVGLRADPAEFIRRRRAKTEAELAGIRRAQRAADAAMARAAELLRAGGDLTAESVRTEMQAVCRGLGCTLPSDVIVGPGAQGAVGHEAGSGPLPPDTPIVIDIWPRDDESGCWADMTRTFVMGSVPGDIAEWHALTLAALERARGAVRAGVTGKSIWELTCDVYEAAGHPTQRSKEEGAVLRDGFFHGLGHGVGLDIHEEPGLGRGGNSNLIAGDVVTLEPGTYRQGYGGVRLEDLVVVTDDGCETLTDFPYDLTP